MTMSALPLDFVVAIVPSVLFVVLRLVDLFKPKPKKKQRRKK